MGNNIDANKDQLNMYIRFIGSNMQTFYDKIKTSNKLKNIIKYWDINLFQNVDFSKQINYYFDQLENYKADEDNKDKNIKECLILKVNNIHDPEINLVLEKMNQLSENQFMPLVLILSLEPFKILEIDTEKYNQIDPRLIFVENYTENTEMIEEKIVPILLRFCSIHNELGDIFYLNTGKNDEEKFDLIERAFPFNLNIISIGRFGQGKSTGVNQILRKYKAKKSNKGYSKTKNITFYQVKNKPIRILDVPGFEDNKTVKDAVDKLKIFGQKLNKIKNYCHIILYFLKYGEKRSFMELEYPIIEEITKHKSAKIIYVITHSKENLKEKIKKNIYDRINSGIQGITRNKYISNNIQMFKANENNVVFVNFHYDEENDIEPFGEKELFKKIYDFFIESEDYKKFQKELTKNEIEENSLKLRAEAQRILLPNIIFGGLVGVIPFFDWAMQKFFIKANAVKKVAEIFGFQINEEQNNKLAKNKKDPISNTTLKLNSDINGITVDDEEIIEQTETNEYVAETASQTTAKVDSQCMAGYQTVKDSKLLATATELGLKANLIEKAANLSSNTSNFTLKTTESAKAVQLADKAKNANIFVKGWHALWGTTSTAALAVCVITLAIYALAAKATQTDGIVAAQIAAIVASQAAQANTAALETSVKLGGATFRKFLSFGFFGIGIALGFGFGVYTTYKFCEEILDKFVDYYKKNHDNIKNSYKEAAEYFL